MQNRNLWPNRRLDLLMFLWRWKVATTAALSKRYFPELTPESAYVTLLRLEQSGFIKSVAFSSQLRNFVWTLTKKGFQEVSRFLPPLKENGFQSENPVHDLLVTAVHLGEHLIDKPTSIEHFTEQELRRVHPEFYPNWIPVDTSHRPDGYWRVENGASHETIALEVELSPKIKSEYVKVGRYYLLNDSVARVLWVVGKPGVAVTVYNQIMGNPASAREIHNFLTLDQFKVTGWQSKIQMGPDVGKTISELLHTFMLPECSQSNIKVALDTRKKALESTKCRIFSEAGFHPISARGGL